MKDIIEIYVKLVIAFFSFVAPSFTILISIFLEGIEKKKATHQEKILEIENLAKTEISKDNPDISTLIEKSNKELEQVKKNSQKELNLLNPQRQILRVFISLSLSIIFIILYYLIKATLTYNQITIKGSILFLSLLCFSYSLFVFWQIFGIIVEVRTSFIEDKKQEIVKKDL